MTFFPVRYKPAMDFTAVPAFFEYTDVISKDLADEIIQLATGYDGWHRRGSKESTIQASFTTTLLHDLEHPIYEKLDELWKRFTDEHHFNIDFIEYYEVKEYRAGDSFGPHVDTHGRVNEVLDRKMNLIIQLSDPETYEGGDLVVLKDQTTKRLGSAIFFPSNYTHYVTEVTSGTRYSLIGHGWGSVYRK